MNKATKLSNDYGRIEGMFSKEICKGCADVSSISTSKVVHWRNGVCDWCGEAHEVAEIDPLETWKPLPKNRHRSDIEQA